MCICFVWNTISAASDQSYRYKSKFKHVDIHIIRNTALSVYIIGGH
jgi:hypothetical protein